MKIRVIASIADKEDDRYGNIDYLIGREFKVIIHEKGFYTIILEGEGLYDIREDEAEVIKE